MTIECERCRDTGYITITNDYTSRYVCARWSPDYAKNVAGSYCYECNASYSERNKVLGAELMRAYPSYAALDRCFNEKGNLIFNPWGNPQHECYSILFDDDDGFLKNNYEYREYILARNFPIDSDAVGLYHADILANNTSGHYPTIYYFR
jgi:hypothetical protein